MKTSASFRCDAYLLPGMLFVVYRKEAGYRTGEAIVFERSIFAEREGCRNRTRIFRKNLVEAHPQICNSTSALLYIPLSRKRALKTIAPMLCDNPRPYDTVHT